MQTALSFLRTSERNSKKVVHLDTKECVLIGNSAKWVLSGSLSFCHQVEAAHRKWEDYGAFRHEEFVKYLATSIM